MYSTMTSSNKIERTGVETDPGDVRASVGYPCLASLP
jgi:hypothetical protein